MSNAYEFSKESPAPIASLQFSLSSSANYSSTVEILSRSQIFNKTRILGLEIGELSRFSQNPFDADYISDEQLEQMRYDAERYFKKLAKEFRDLEVQTIALLESERLYRKQQNAA